MENPRPEKVAIVDEVRQRLTDSGGVIVTEYRGLNVADLSSLRRELRPAGGAYKIYKNTLVRRAANEVGMEIDEFLVGPTALAFVERTPEGGSGDVVTVAKILKNFAKTNPNLIVKGGVLDANVLDADAMSKLADVESREVLLAKMAGAIAAPMQQFAGLLQALPRDFAFGLKALIDIGGASDAPETVAPTEAETSASPEADASTQADNEDTPADAGQDTPADAGEETES